jgi:ATP-dependent protease HslVU (ClpYQ) ATPase subunit
VDVLNFIHLKVVEETYNCTEKCESLDISIEQNQLAYRLIKLRIRVLRANIGKLLCLCVPEREKWTEFGWDGKTVDEILDDLSKIDIPVHHPGDPEFQRTFAEHEKSNSEYMAAEKIEDQEQKRKNDVKGSLQQTQENICSSNTLDKIEAVVQESFKGQPNEMVSEKNAMVIDAEKM